MKSLSLRAVLGSFRILRDRAAAVGQPGLEAWTETGEAATRKVGRQVLDKVHADEVADLEAAKHIRAGLDGLKDGRVDAVDLQHFQAAERLTKRSAELAHDAGEIVRL